MSTKKSFSIPKGLANGLRTSIQSANTNSGQLHYDMLPLDKIETDPENPRKLLITIDDLRNGLNKSDHDYVKKDIEFQALNELSESIKKVGVRNAIEIFKNGDNYRIISGERRFLASFLAGQKYIPAKISQKMDDFKLRYVQWVENINRQDLSLIEKYNNLTSIAIAYKNSNDADLTDLALKDLLGVSDTQAYRYFCLLNADNEIIELVKSGKILNLKAVQELVVKKGTDKKKLLDEIKNAPENTSTSLDGLKKLIGKKKATRKYINFGKTVHPQIAKYFMETLVQQPEFDKFRQKLALIDWQSHKDVNNAFKKMISVLEKALPIKETV